MSFRKSVFCNVISGRMSKEFGAWGEKNWASAGSWTISSLVAQFCPTQTDAFFFKATYICRRSALATSGQLNAKAKRTLDAHTGEYIQDLVTVGRILWWRGSHVEEFLHWRERKHPWPQTTADSLRGRGRMVTDDIVLATLSSILTGQQSQVFTDVDKKPKQEHFNCGWI